MTIRKPDKEKKKKALQDEISRDQLHYEDVRGLVTKPGDGILIFLRKTLEVDSFPEPICFHSDR
jgi:hypothetical protein